MRILKIFFTFLSIPCAPLSTQCMELSFPTSKEDSHTTLSVGTGLHAPESMFNAVQDPLCKEVLGSIAFGGSSQYFKFIGECTKGLRKGSLNKAVLIVNKHNVLKKPSQREILNKFIAQGGKVYCSGTIHDKTLVTDRMVISGSSNVSKSASKFNNEAYLSSTDSPIKKSTRKRLKKALKYATIYLGDNVIPESPKKKKRKRDEAFASRKNAISVGGKMHVASSYTHDIATDRTRRLEKVAKSDKKKRRIHIETMTGFPNGLLESAKSGADICFITDESGVTRETRNELKKLAAYKNVKAYARKRNSSGIQHAKVFATQRGSKKITEISTQNNAQCSGKDFNTSFIAPIDTWSPIKRRQNTIDKDESYIKLTPTLRHFDALHPKNQKSSS